MILEKVVTLQGEVPPSNLINILDRLKGFPNSARLCNEAVSMADSLLKKEAKLESCPAKCSVLVYQNPDERIIFGVAYQKHKPMRLINGTLNEDSYSFYLPDKNIKICITQLKTKIADNSRINKNAQTIEFINTITDKVIQSYSFQF